MTDIRIDATTLRTDWPLPDPPTDGTKHGRGTVVVLGGAAQTPGAVLLAGIAALRVGAGRLQIATVASTAGALAVATPEAAVIALSTTKGGGIDKAGIQAAADAVTEADAVLIGPGMTEPDSTLTLVEEVLTAVPPDAVIVLDALALTCGIARSATFEAHASQMVITPNPKEVEHLLGHSAPDDSESATTLASTLGAVTICGSVIADADRGSWLITKGNVGLATSGSGDVLAGAVAGLGARGADPTRAALWAVFLHASAGDRLAQRIGPLGFLARELLDELPGALPS